MHNRSPQTTAPQDTASGQEGNPFALPPDQRASHRWRVLEEAEIITKAGRTACQVQDISPIGANIAVETPLAVGCEVSLILIGFGAVPADVAWSDGASAGVKFTYDEHHRGVMTDWLMLIVDM